MSFAYLLQLPDSNWKEGKQTRGKWNMDFWMNSLRGHDSSAGAAPESALLDTISSTFNI